ncbi:hypothetical protein Cob_v005793 [Colletotrichum orbiculare MAFF 240422]|uniref:Uncharacterized protein n=1 Tax=Colletotrichum orbiculare (strain 104-T / ATCC 96160 / CBS 514.97 / LARS 414 / MAFF 240422) TaxID=1213857 RepID=N4VWB4_COLOR|nr:hypothetical protein Cob_v005793 [Colletotrichum orbiculare MAFF 240422]
MSVEAFDVDFAIGVDMNATRGLSPHDVSTQTRGKIYATQDRWDLYRLLITRLYREEKKPLREVQIIMEQQHSFLATERMFKTRIKRWGLDKKFKEPEVFAMLYAKQKRDAVGKESEFVIRDQVVNWEDVTEYLKRRRRPPKSRQARNLRELGITCRTPLESKSGQIGRVMAAAIEVQFFEDILRLKRC